jgi:type VI secretion system protein ImpA
LFRQHFWFELKAQIVTVTLFMDIKRVNEHRLQFWAAASSWIASIWHQPHVPAGRRPVISSSNASANSGHGPLDNDQTVKSNLSNMNHLNEILTPITGDTPCGKSLSYSKEFDDLAELRRADEPLLSQKHWETALKTADWGKVESQSTKLLINTSKDLRLAMWLTEACTFNHGYPGMRYGLEVFTELCARYWDGIYPLPDGGDMDERIGKIRWLIRRVTELTTTAVVVVKGEQASYTLAQKDHAKTTPEGLEQFKLDLRATPKPELAQTLQDLDACQTALAALQAQIDARFGGNADDAPSFGSAREALQNAMLEIGPWAQETDAAASTKDKKVPAASSPATPKTLISSPAAASVATLPNEHKTPKHEVAAGPLQSREQALRQLRDVAHFFRTTEPHSPVAYLADKAAQWGEMALHEWLRSVVKEGGSLAQLEELLGIKPHE